MVMLYTDNVDGGTVIQITFISISIKETMNIYSKN